MTKFSILIPHFRNGKTTAYAVSQWLKYKGEHEIDIVVINNSPQDDSIKYLEPFKKDVVIAKYPTDVIQSHAVSFDWAIMNGLVKHDAIILSESDAWPTSNDYLNSCEEILNDGFDIGANILKLSGGTFFHAAGMLLTKKVWQEAKDFCDKIPYQYFPNMISADGFQYHAMIHNSVLDAVLNNPEDYFDLADGYKPYSKELALTKLYYYSPIRNPLHNGMGEANESIHTYGLRTFDTEVPHALIDGKRKIMRRVGYEPSQFISYWAMAIGKKICNIEVEIKWLPNRENQQQEYTLMKTGFKHIWAGSSFLDMKDTEYHDVYEFKKNQIEELYNSLPQNQKISLP